MNIYEIIKSVANVIGDLYDFVKNILTYQVELFGETFKVIELIGYIGGIGLATYVVVLIIKLFTE